MAGIIFRKKEEMKITDKKNKFFNYINNSPWQGAFIIPYIALSLSFFGSNLSGVFGLIFGALLIINPIWLIFGMIVSKKKLPYILSFLIFICFIIFEANRFLDGFK